MADDVTDSPPEDDPWASARAAVLLPATLLIVIGAISLLMAILLLLARDSMPARFDEKIAEVENDGQLSDDEKDVTIDGLEFLRSVIAQPTAMLGHVINIAASGLVILGGVKLLNLSGPALPSIGATVAMLPCTVMCCCALGLPVGVWAIVAMCRTDVRAAMAASRDRQANDGFGEDYANRE